MSWRKGLAQHSKFRNVFGEPYRKDKCYENVKFSKNAWDGTYCSVNPKFLAVVLDTSGAGGAFLVIPLEKVGRQKIDTPRIAGHQREILDIQWNPFNDHIIASASEDTTVKIWRIPSGGLQEDLLEPLVDLRGHKRKVGVIRWHPTANGIIASAAFDFKIIVWNALKAKALCTIDGHRDTIFDLAFNYNGSLIATTSKDKKIRVIDPRTGNITKTFAGHSSPKTSHLAFTDKTGDCVVTTGFSSSGQRQVSLWNLNTSSAVATIDIDNSSSILMLHYDMDVHVAYAAGKGDGMISYFEVRKEEPFLMRLSEYRHATPQKSLGKMSKRGLESNRCEIFRFYKLHPSNWIEPLSMFCPRRSDEFQEDLYPPTASMVPALTAEEWNSGIDKDPVLMAVKDGIFENPASMSPTSYASSADKYNSMFNKPAKFEKQVSNSDMISNDMNHNEESPSSSSFITKTTTQEVHSAVDNEEHEELEILCSERGREIEMLKGTISTKDERILKLEKDLASKENELSLLKERYSKNVSELREANSRLASKSSKQGVDTNDGSSPRGETTFTKTSQTSVQSMPERQDKPLVQESITSTKRSHQIDDHELNRALEEVHVNPVRTNAPYGKQTPGSQTPESLSPRRQIASESQSPRSPGYGNQPLGSQALGSQTTGTKTHGSSSEECRIEDIEAELESLRDDLARTRETRQASKSSVRYVSDDYTPRQTSSTEGPPSTRSDYSENVTKTSDVSSPRSRGYSGGNSESGFGSGSQKRDLDGKRMIITTASYARVPKHETSETTFTRQTSSKDKKVSKLIERFNKPVSVDPSKNSHRRRTNSGESLGRVLRIQRSRKERPKSAMNFEHWEKLMKSNNV